MNLEKIVIVEAGISWPSGFYLASMWTNPPGGIPGTASVGRQVVQILCHEDGQRFVASTP
jgi:hypothetical protein